MSSERSVDPFAALILVLSIIAIILIAALNFAGFYLPGYGNRFSCLDCEYYTDVDLTAQVFMLILLIIQVIIVLNDLVPKRFIKADLDKIGIGFAALTFLFAIIGLASFGAEYSDFEWWPAEGFYGGIIAGLLNTILFFLKSKNK
ncbi:MAG: hypothetical protein ACFFG0_14950 [Candidatus Thorarchaeota archaeon]